MDSPEAIRVKPFSYGLFCVVHHMARGPVGASYEEDIWAMEDYSGDVIGSNHPPFPPRLSIIMTVTYTLTPSEKHKPNERIKTALYQTLTKDITREPGS